MAKWGRSALDSDDVCLDLAIDGPGSEPFGYRCGCEVGCFAERAPVARLDFIAKRRPLAVGERGDAR